MRWPEIQDGRRWLLGNTKPKPHPHKEEEAQEEEEETDDEEEQKGLLGGHHTRAQ
jgi:hypothetical protein